MVQVFHGRGDTTFLVSRWNNYRQQFQVITFWLRRHNAAEMSDQFGLASTLIAIPFSPGRRHGRVNDQGTKCRHTSVAAAVSSATNLNFAGGTPATTVHRKNHFFSGVV